MDNTIPFFIQQIKEQCKWYFGHDVQVITYIDQATKDTRVVVYPADWSLSSAFGRPVHLHASGNIYYALREVLSDIRERIGKCFRAGGPYEVPVLLECEAPCNCLQSTVSLAEGGEGSDAQDAEIGLPSGELESTIEADPERVFDIPNVTTRSSGPGTQACAAHDILPVIQKIQITLEVIGQRMQHCPVDTATSGNEKPVHLRVGQTGTTVQSPLEGVMPTDDETLLGKRRGSTVLSECASPATEPTGAESLVPTHSSATKRTSQHVGDVTSEPRTTMSDSATGGFSTPKLGPDEGDEHARDLIREEIGLVLAEAMESLARLARRRTRI